MRLHVIYGCLRYIARNFKSWRSNHGDHVQLLTICSSVWILTAGKEPLKDQQGSQLRVSNSPAGNVYIEDNEKRHVIVGPKLIWVIIIVGWLAASNFPLSHWFMCEMLMCQSQEVNVINRNAMAVSKHATTSSACTICCVYAFTHSYSTHYKQCRWQDRCMWRTTKQQE